MVMLAGAGGVSAQTAGGPSSDIALEEIVVTATRRSERLQDVSIAVSALGGTQLERLGAEGFRTIANRIVGLQLNEGFRNTSQLTIRGVNTGATRQDRPQQRATTGLYLDDTAINAVNMNPNIPLFDLERVEVLRGPQGTLYGASSMAGAIRYITRKPELGVLGAGGSLSMSGTDGGDESYSGQGVFNLPVGERAAFRALGYHRSVGGFYEQTRFDIENVDDSTTYGGRLSFRMEPAENFTVTAMTLFNEQQFDDKRAQVVRIGNEANLDTVRDMGLLATLDDSIRISALTLDYDIGFGTLTSISSYFDKEHISIDDLGRIVDIVLGVDLFNTGRLVFSSVDFPESPLTTVNEIEQFTQEIRLVSSGDDRLNWVVGGYYSDATRDYLQAIDTFGLNDARVAAGIGSLPNPGLSADRYFEGVFKITDEQLAFFGELRYDFTDNVTLTVGGRYFDFEHNADNFFAGFLGGNAGVVIKHEEDGFNPKINLSWQLDENKLLYGQVSQGFRLGGASERVPPSLCGDELAALGLAESPESFDSDSLINYEVGAKTGWRDGSVTLNVAAYRSGWSDAQAVLAMNCGFNLFANGANVVVNGAELEVEAQFSNAARGFFGVAHTDSRLDGDAPNLGPDSAQSPYVPEWAFNGGMDYTLYLTGSELLISADFQYVDERFTQYADIAGINPSITLDSYFLAHARAVLTRDDWEYSLAIRNLTGEEAVVGGSIINLPVPGASTRRIFTRPTMATLSVRRAF